MLSAATKVGVPTPEGSERKIAHFAYTGLIDSNGATRIAAALNAAVNDRYDFVHISISSIGGQVADTIFLYNHIRSLPLSVVMHNTGSISSTSIAVFLAAEDRYCSSHARFVIHPMAISALGGMTVERLQSSLDAALSDEQRIESILRERASLPDDVLNGRHVRDIQILPEDAIRFGLVREVREFALQRGNQITQI